MFPWREIVCLRLTSLFVYAFIAFMRSVVDLNCIVNLYSEVRV